MFQSETSIKADDVTDSKKSSEMSQSGSSIKTDAVTDPKNSYKRSQSGSSIKTDAVTDPKNSHKRSQSGSSIKTDAVTDPKHSHKRSLFRSWIKENVVPAPKKPSVITKRQEEGLKPASSRLQGRELWLNQTKAMFFKRWVSFKRSWIIYLVCGLFTILLLIIQVQFPSGEPEPRSMSLGNYKHPKAIIVVGEGGKAAADAYKDVVSPDSEPIVVEAKNGNAIDNMHKTLVEQWKKTPRAVRYRYIAGASFDDETRVWFNDQPYHSVPLTINLHFNSLLKAGGVKMDLQHAPLPRSKDEVNRGQTQNSGMLPEHIVFAFILIVAYYALFPVNELSVNSKHLQLASGQNTFIFWAVHFIFDFITFLAVIVLLIIVLIPMKFDGFKTATELAVMFLVLICFAWSMLPFIYLLSFLFKLPATAFIWTAVIFFAGQIIILLCNVLKTTNHHEAAKIVQWIFISFPPYCFLDALVNMYVYFMFTEQCQKFSLKDLCATKSNNPCCHYSCDSNSCTRFQIMPPGIGRNILFFLLTGVLFFILLILLDENIIEKLISRCCTDALTKWKRRKNPKTTERYEDTDVLAEKQKIRNLSEDQLKSDYAVAIRDVTKYYNSHLAVDSVSFTVKRGECFGLLGLNGAGKTSLFKMMTSDTRISQGDGYLEGNNIRTESKKVHKSIGYCPQFDALLDKMKPRETIRMYCLIRGIPEKDIPEITDKLSKELELDGYLDQAVEELSGGNKRKVSVAVALIADPPVVFLDEPSTGLDPRVRRRMWDIIIQYRKNGGTIILTSHSMDECEALCTMMTVMVNGTLRCMGSVQYLKNKYATSYSLIIKITLATRASIRRDPNIVSVKKFMRRSFPDATIQEEYRGMLRYEIPSERYKWSEIFGTMEKAKQSPELKIEDYSLTQSTLEQVFLSITKPEQGKRTSMK